MAISAKARERSRLFHRIVPSWSVRGKNQEYDSFVTEVILDQGAFFNFDFHQFCQGSGEELNKKYEIVECPMCLREFVRWIDEEYECKTRFCSDDCQEWYEEEGL